ncbi:hypothetical protein [Psychrobacillus sp. BM2]|uniref:hypothetical protein n=1 Tax=Psychrobacillus sp. BM2 TaxID=3400421 RepID=UPI003B02E89A
MSYYNNMRSVRKEVIGNRLRPYFKWKRKDGKYNVDILNHKIETFFYLVTNSKNMYDDLRLPQICKPRDYDNLFQTFISDAIVSVLNDSILNIQKFFRNAKNREKHSELFKKVFFQDADTFMTQLKEYLLTLDHQNNKDDIIYAAEINAEIIYFNIPKLLLPWYIYALGYTLEDNKDINVKNYNEMVIVKKSKLPLHFTKSENPIEVEKFISAQVDFKDFILSLNKCKNDKLNKSLNLYLFNEATNLLDIHKALSMFVNDSYFLREEYERNEDDLYHKDSKKYKFEEISKATKINNLGVKAFLINNEYYNKMMFLDKMTWLIFNVLFKEMKRTLIEFMRNESQVDWQDIPENINIDFTIYDAFSQMEPFSDILEKVIADEIKIYDGVNYENVLEKVFLDNKAVKEKTIFEAYGYAYKSFYRARNPLKKSINQFTESESYGDFYEVFMKFNYPHKYKKQD